MVTGETGEPGIDGALMPWMDLAQPYVNTINVANLDESLALIEASGGTCELPGMPLPGVGWLAYCKDTEEHIFGMMQGDQEQDFKD